MTDPFADHPQRADHPRPMLVRDGWTSLDGRWRFAYDDEEIGLEGRWFEAGHASTFDRSIVVPYPPESSASGIGDRGFHPVVWYAREVDARGLLGTDADRIGDVRWLLHFGAVDYYSTVWVDGIEVASHAGGLTPFAADITDRVRGAVPVTVVVRAVDRSRDKSQPTGKQDWRLEPRGIRYERTTGIWQTVWLEVAPSRRVESLSWRPSLDEASLDVTIGVTPGVTANQPGDDLVATVRLSHDGSALAEQTFTVSAATSVTLDIPALRDPGGRAALSWSPENPVLLDASVTLGGSDPASPPVDRVASYVGLRSVAVSGGRFLLNGEPYEVRAVLNQGYWPTTHLAAPDLAALRADVDLAKAMGFNTMRIHQKAEDPRQLQYADRVGMLVWAETANARAFTPRATDLAVHEWSDLVRRDRSHPCVAAWVPMNESWGVPDLTTSQPQRSYLRELATLTRELDPSRPVLSNDGWEHVDSDIIGIHDYVNDAGVLLARYGNDAAVKSTVDGPGPQDRPLTLNPGQRRAYLEGRAPPMLTEFGGVSFSEDGTWGYTTVSTDAEYEAVLAEIFAAVRACTGLAGWCYTQLADTRQETNGLLTADRRPKLPVDVVAAMVCGPTDSPARRTAAIGRAKLRVLEVRRRLRPVKALVTRTPVEDEDDQ